MKDYSLDHAVALNDAMAKVVPDFIVFISSNKLPDSIDDPLPPGGRKFFHDGWGDVEIVKELPEHCSWADFYKMVHEMIVESGDFHHRFFEGVRKSGRDDADLNLIMGS